ncbi:MAG: amino acid ABC transporter substrate-binding protein, partial [Selenomonadaceae bacterium]|nr:amino acid ABC transporter substrate-binding protein [Selenomonadaceae bacterium]
MKKIFVAVVILVVMMFAGCGMKTEKFIIGIDDDFPPIGFRNEQGKLIGFDIDLAKEAARRMDVEFDFKSIDWDNKREEIILGNVDMIWNGLDITEERKEYMIFTKPYMDDRQILLVKVGNAQGIDTEGDLEGKVIGVQAGSSSENYLHNKKSLRDTFKNYKTYLKFTAAVDALKRDEIDVVICDEMVARYEMRSHPDELELINVRIGNITEMGVGFRKEDTVLRNRVQEALDEMIKDGTAKEISEKWFQADLIK